MFTNCTKVSQKALNLNKANLAATLTPLKSAKAIPDKTVTAAKKAAIRALRKAKVKL